MCVKQPHFRIHVFFSAASIFKSIKYILNKLLGFAYVEVQEVAVHVTIRSLYFSVSTVSKWSLHVSFT